MGLDIIKQLQDEVKEVTAQLEAVKADRDAFKVDNDTLKELSDKVDSFEEKKLKFDEEMSTAIVVDKADLEKRASDLVLKSKLSGIALKDLTGYKELSTQVEKAIKPDDITNWIDEAFSKEIIDLMNLDLKVEKLFGEVIVPDGVGTMSLPQKTGRSSAYLIQPAQDAVESALTAGKVSFSPKKLKTMVITAIESNQEAVIDSMLNVVKEDIAYSLAKGVEDAIINGDTSGDINNAPTATNVNKAFNALRKYGMSNTIDAGGDAITLADIRTARAKMGVYGINPSEVVILVTPASYYQLLDIDVVQTIDKIGSSAVIKTGTIGQIDGMDILITENIPVTLGADGKDSGGVLTGALLVNVKAFRVGKRKWVEFEQDKSIVNDTNIYVGRVYRDFNKLAQGDTAVSYIINLSV